jgi:hypothetical protein
MKITLLLHLTILIVTCTTPAFSQEAAHTYVVTINVKEGPAITGTFLRADAGGVQVDIGSGQAIIKLENINSIVFSSSESPVQQSLPPNDLSAEASQRAVKALRKLANATQIGVSYLDYNPLVIEAKTEIDDALTQVPEGALTAAIRASIYEYQVAADVWNRLVHTGSIPTKSELGRSLINAYQIPIKIGMFTSLSRDLALSYIWRAGRAKFEKAESLLQQK